ncbi:hypothetical protein P0136_10630 [Lentisphaerota bacterium ZTH]|nr:hypothetical protein JYG24_11855 [Lentisphaerota bacterium]WET05816.1 hypothetical protein P0136_10630 [Lentisphaerota bacterium ZTH]
MHEFPKELTSGFSHSWEVTLPEYPTSESWNIRYLVRIKSDRLLDIPATTSDNAYQFSISSDDLKGVLLSVVPWQCVAVKGDIRKLVTNGKVKLVPDLSDTSVDFRDYPEKMLAAVDAVLEGRLDDPITEVEYNGRRLKYLPVNELLELRKMFLTMLPQNQRIQTIRMEFR